MKNLPPMHTVSEDILHQNKDMNQKEEEMDSEKQDFPVFTAHGTGSSQRGPDYT